MEVFRQRRDIIRIALYKVTLNAVWRMTCAYVSEWVGVRVQTGREWRLE